MDSLSRELRKDIRKGTRLMSLMALRALFEVSLRNCQLLTIELVFVNTHERHQIVVMTLSANSYISFLAFSGASFGDSRYWERT